MGAEVLTWYVSERRFSAKTVNIRRRRTGAGYEPRYFVGST